MSSSPTRAREHLDPVVAALELDESDRCGRGPGQHLVDTAAVLAGEPGQPGPPLGDLLQPTRLGLEVAEIAGQITGHLGQGVAGLGQPAAQVVEHRVSP